MEINFVGITQGLITLLPAVMMWKYCIVCYQAHGVWACKLSEYKAANQKGKRKKVKEMSEWRWWGFDRIGKFFWEASLWKDCVQQEAEEAHWGKALKNCNGAEFRYLKRKAKGPINLMNAFEIMNVISIRTKSLDWFLISWTSQN